MRINQLLQLGLLPRGRIKMKHIDTITSEHQVKKEIISTRVWSIFYTSLGTGLGSSLITKNIYPTLLGMCILSGDALYAFYKVTSENARYDQEASLWNETNLINRLSFPKRDNDNSLSE